MTSRKRVRTSSESTCRSLGSVFKIERAPKPVIKGYKKTTIDDETVFLESEPPGKDVKDKMMSYKDITNLLCPKVYYKIKHYGFNYGGDHRMKTANIIGGGGIDTVAAGNGIHTDALRFVYDNDSRAQSDTIAWTAGTQAWYESLSLPGTWMSELWDGEAAQKYQPSMVGLINMGKYGLTHLGSSTLMADPNDNKERDFEICYCGGEQVHTFVNQNEHEIFYELWELAPRDIVNDWIESVPDTVDVTQRGVFKNIHTLVTYGYNHMQPFGGVNTGAESAVNNLGSYTVPLGGAINADGQRILQKNDLGFRINPGCVDLYHKFRVSKGQRGSLKFGSVLKYKLKHGPFNIKNSVWNRWVEGIRPDANPIDDNSDAQLRIYTHGHLVPCATKIMCIRFWSELGNRNTFNALETGTFKFDYDNVTHVPGRVIHTVDENHTIRCVPYVKQNQYVIKNFRSTDYGPNTTGWRVVNDETNTQMTTDETN